MLDPVSSDRRTLFGGNWLVKRSPADSGCEHVRHFVVFAQHLFAASQQTHISINHVHSGQCEANPYAGTRHHNLLHAHYSLEWCWDRHGAGCIRQLLIHFNEGETTATQ